MKPVRRKKKPSHCLQQILEVKALLLELYVGQIRMELRMSQELDHLKTVVDEAVAAMVAAIERMGNTDNPADLKAEADRLSAAVEELKAAM